MLDPRVALDALLGLTGRLTEASSLEASLKLVTDAALVVVPGAEHASIRVLDDEGRELVCGARSGSGDDSPPAHFERGEGVVGWVVEQGCSTRVADSTDDPRFARAGDQGFDVRSLVAAPLWSGRTVVGVLSASNPSLEAFDDADERMMCLLANCAAPQIEKARLERLANTDAHTRSFSQRYLMPRLTSEIDAATKTREPLSVMLLDLDGFKAINDAHGHAAGDAALQHFANRVRGCTRRYDVFVRRGGDEFVLIMPNTDIQAGTAIASRIAKAVRSNPIVTSAGKVSLSVSIGVVQWQADEDAKAIEARADAAMYRAKKAGKDRVEAQS